MADHEVIGGGAKEEFELELQEENEVILACSYRRVK